MVRLWINFQGVSMQMAADMARTQAAQTDVQVTLRECMTRAAWAQLKAVAQSQPKACFQAFSHMGFADTLSSQPVPALLIFANLCLQNDAQSAAGWALYYAARQLGGVEHLPLPMQNVMLRHHPLWTQDVVGQRTVLVRPRPEHHGALLALLQDRDFTGRFNAFLPPPEVAAQEFIERTTPQFENNKQIHWLIQTPAGQTTGLVTLSGFDFINRRAEIQFGFNDAAADGRARMEAFQLVLYLAFNELKLAKLCSLVYSSNQPAQDMTLKMGLTQEGRLRKHLLLPGQAQAIDIYVNSMLLQEFQTSEVVQRHSRLVFKNYNPTQLFEQARAAVASH